MENDDELLNELESLNDLQVPEPESKSDLQLAIEACDPNRVGELLEAGADARYRRKKGYDALIDAAYRCFDNADPQPLETMRLLLQHGAAPNGVTEYGETAVQVVWRSCNAAAVRLLLDSGADKSLLHWTPLLEAVALGSSGDVQSALQNDPPLEERDCWLRTPWLVALRIGDLSKAKLLHAAGVNVSASRRGNTPAIHDAVESRNAELVRWVVDRGVDVDAVDDMGMTALETAVAADDFATVEALLECGATVIPAAANPPLQSAQSRPMVLRLIEAGADLADLSSSGRRAFVGLVDLGEDAPLAVTAEDYRQARTRRFGSRNPERMDFPFWKAMIASGWSGYLGSMQFESQRNYDGAPVWSAMRFGQSFTLLDDGRVIQIGGEHEDGYDPDFCIYNDVFVHEVDGSFAVYGYPDAVFPPTDFHTATLIGGGIYVIGSLGYAGSRRNSETPIHRLDVKTLRFERVEADGDAPGWIYKHRAAAEGGGAIRIWGGEIVTGKDGAEVHEPNQATFVLDLPSRRWSRI